MEGEGREGGAENGKEEKDERTASTDRQASKRTLVSSLFFPLAHVLLSTTLTLTAAPEAYFIGKPSGCPITNRGSPTVAVPLRRIGTTSCCSAKRSSCKKKKIITFLSLDIIQFEFPCLSTHKVFPSLSSFSYSSALSSPSSPPPFVCLRCVPPPQHSHLFHQASSFQIFHRKTHEKHQSSGFAGREV